MLPGIQIGVNVALLFIAIIPTWIVVRDSDPREDDEREADRVAHELERKSVASSTGKDGLDDLEPHGVSSALEHEQVLKQANKDGKFQ